MSEWRAQEQQIQTAIDGFRESTADRVLSAKRTLELANKAYSLYLTQDSAEQAKLLRMVLLNCAIDAASVYPTYRKPFDMIFQRAKNEEWSGRADLNCRPLAPQASALPG
jgi:site-specific DNA recombinase